MPFNRNVFVYDGGSRQEIAGFWQYGRVSVATFYSWLQATLVVQSLEPFRLSPCDSPENLMPNGLPLDPTSETVMQAGFYVLLRHDGTVVVVGHVINMPLRRVHSYNYTSTPHSTDFTTRVRDRDRRCCFTGRPVVGNNFTGFEAAHIFPLGQTDEWNRRNLHQFIDDPIVSGTDKMNSVQQGFLACSTEHKLFVDYQLGVNPDDEYRITDFGGAHPEYTLDGQIFYINPEVPEHFRPSDALLRDHYFQCVLACMKAAAKPHDVRKFDPDLDLTAGGFNLEQGGWWATVEGKSQLEVELRARLAHRENRVVRNQRNSDIGLGSDRL